MSFGLRVGQILDALLGAEVEFDPVRARSRR